MNAVKGVLFHNLDHLDASIQQKEEYHKYCSSRFCEFRQWVESSKPVHEYISVKPHRDLHDNLEDCKAGLLARFDVRFPETLKKLVKLFDNLGSRVLMERTVNDSLHSKLWRLVVTFKSHGAKRYNFACKMVMMI